MFPHLSFYSKTTWGMWQLADQQAQRIKQYLNKKAQYVTLAPALSSLVFSFSSSPQPFQVMNKIIQSLLNSSSKMRLSTQSIHRLSRTTTCSQEKKEKKNIYYSKQFSSHRDILENWRHSQLLSPWQFPKSRIKTVFICY